MRTLRVTYCNKPCQDIETSFNQITIDGDTSTNDMVLVMANGQAGNQLITQADAAYEQFKAMLHHVTTTRAIAIANDGEGATKLITVTVTHAASATAARLIAKKVVGSSLVKTAMFGKDPNWGRIIAAIGAAETAITPETIAISINGYSVMQAGAPVAFDQAALAAALEDPHITIQIDLNNGAATGQAWGSDLTYDYVKINALYTT